jgi:hypothetical protein
MLFQKMTVPLPMSRKKTTESNTRKALRYKIKIEVKYFIYFKL